MTQEHEKHRDGMERKRTAELDLRDAIIEAVPVNGGGHAFPVHDRIYDAIMDDEIEWALRELVCNEDFRQIVREEIRRDSVGARCPECGETDQGISLEEIERQTDEDEEYIWNCPSCEFSGPVQIFDPLHQQQTRIHDNTEDEMNETPSDTELEAHSAVNKIQAENHQFEGFLKGVEFAIVHLDFEEISDREDFEQVIRKGFAQYVRDREDE